MITPERARRKQEAENNCFQACIQCAKAYGLLRLVLDRPKPDWGIAEQTIGYLLSFVSQAKEREAELQAVVDEISGVPKINGHDPLPIIPPDEVPVEPPAIEANLPEDVKPLTKLRLVDGNGAQIEGQP